MPARRSVNCWKCGKQTGEPGTKVLFRAVCSQCGFDSHVCKNCRYYAPGKPNDCAVPGTDFIKDREAANFCEEFRPGSGAPPSSSVDQARSRFGLEPEKKRKLEDLFGEDDS